MPIYRCSDCGFVGEEVFATAGNKLPCTKCGTANTLFATPFYVQKVLERYQAMRRELEALKSAVSNPGDESSPEAAAPSRAGPLNPENLGNTALLATEEQHQPLREWFAARQIKATFALDAVDTTGYFDEAAHEIGAHHEALESLMEQIRFAYRKEFSWIRIDLSERSPAVREGILAFCRQLYGYTLFSRYSFKKQTQELGLGIQPALVVQEFFMGAWLEWHALVTLLNLCAASKRDFSCARNVTLAMQNGDKRELDVVVLLGGRKLVVIECKTGEFRADLAKYTKLRQQLGMDQTQFMLCNPELPDEQLAGLGKMYELTFVNLRTLHPYLERLI